MSSSKLESQLAKDLPAEKFQVTRKSDGSLSIKGKTVHLRAAKDNVYFDPNSPHDSSNLLANQVRKHVEGHLGRSYLEGND